MGKEEPTIIRQHLLRIYNGDYDQPIEATLADVEEAINSIIERKLRKQLEELEKQTAATFIAPGSGVPLSVIKQMKEKL